ncbi:hypothetical protein WEU32_06730 [Brevundimonas sp. BH3]|nr:hypothetical protein [Brevundimonas sp.]
MRPFHRFLVRLVIAFSLVVLIATLFQRASTMSEPTGQTAAVSSLESEHA